MDRRSFLQFSGRASAALMLLGATRAAANNLPAEPSAPQPAAPQPPAQAAPAQPPAVVSAAQEQKAFSEDWLKAFARDLATKPYEPQQPRVPEELRNLNYDTYRLIRYNKAQAIWGRDKLNYNLELFHAGYIFGAPVALHVVEDGAAREIAYAPSLFNYAPPVTPPPADSNAGFSGFRAHGPIVKRDRMDEFVVFLGASYFRSFAPGQEYGISARGLAVNTAQPQGEEFPMFRSFWIEKPRIGSDVLVIHALLDSDSVAGVYKFIVTSGPSTIMDVDCTLFPRKPIGYAGIAPLTSMFHSGPSDMTQYGDYRPRVYDSEGLEIWNGRGERLWRPLINPERLQFSVFVDESPKGFGLSIRNRDFDNYQDLQVRYEKRPSLWIEPLDNWGPGSVDLIELPTPTEYNDNIVAFWRPAMEMQPGQAYRYRYRMHWCWDPPIKRNLATVSQTRIAQAAKPGWHSVHIDFKGTEGFNLCAEYDEFCLNKRRNLQISASQGAIGDIFFQANAAEGGHRVSFDFRTKGVEQADLRCVLTSDGAPISEIWTYRWTA